MDASTIKAVMSIVGIGVGAAVLAAFLGPYVMRASNVFHRPTTKKHEREYASQA